MFCLYTAWQNRWSNSSNFLVFSTSEAFRRGLRFFKYGFYQYYVKFCPFKLSLQSIYLAINNFCDRFISDSWEVSSKFSKCSFLFFVVFLLGWKFLLLFSECFSLCLLLLQSKMLLGSFIFKGVSYLINMSLNVLLLVFLVCVNSLWSFFSFWALAFVGTLLLSKKVFCCYLVFF